MSIGNNIGTPIVVVNRNSDCTPLENIGMSIGKRLYEARKEAGLTQNQLALKSGVKQPTISELERGDSQSSGSLAQMAAALGVNALWLETGKGPKKSSAIPSSAYTGPERRAFQNVRVIPQTIREIPVISLIQAGTAKEISDPYPPGAGFDVEYIDVGDEISEWAFALEIEGNSMMPEFRPGDRVIIDPELSPNPGDFVAAKNSKKEATFKKYRPRGLDATGNMVFELVPLNDDYPTMRSEIEKLEIIGVMVEHRKKYRLSKRKR